MGMYNNVDWEGLQLDPILMHQLKTTMDPINFQCPTYLHFVEGPAFKFQSVESKEELLASVTVQLADLQGKSAKHELFNFIERKSPLVTGNSFCQLKHPETQTTIEEEFSDKFPNMIESGDPYTMHKTGDMIRFIGTAVAMHGCNLEWFLQLSPNFWPVVMRLLLSYAQVFNLQQLRDDSIVYWLGKFNYMKLAPFEIVKVLQESVERQEGDTEGEKPQLKFMMGGLKRTINRMRKVCEAGSNRHEKIVVQKNELQRSVDAKEKSSKTLTTTSPALEKEIEGLKGKLAEIDKIDSADADLHEYATYLSEILEGCLTRFDPAVIRDQPEEPELEEEDGDREEGYGEEAEPTIEVTATGSEMSAKTTYQRFAKGPISITECSLDGKFLVLENTSKRKDQNLDGWLIKRKVDNTPEMIFNFPKGFVLKSGKAVKVWARAGGGVHKPPEEIVWNEAENLGVGSNIVTMLYSDKQEEKAKHIQGTIYETA